MRRYDEALEALETARNLDPQHPTLLAFIGLVRLAMGQPPLAVAFFERAAAVYPHFHQLALKGFAYGLAGRHEDARAVLRQLSTIAEGAYVSPYSFAWVYLGLHEVESWKRMMDATVDERNGLLPMLRAPYNDTIRADPFFEDLCRRVGLPAIRS